MPLILEQMENYQKLDEILSDLDGESKRLKSLNPVIDRLDKLNDTVIQYVNSLEEQKTVISSITSSLKDGVLQLEEARKALAKSEGALKKHSESLDKKLDSGLKQLSSDLTSSSEKTNETIAAEISGIKELQSTQANDLKLQVETLQNDLSLFKRELDANILTRLDKHKSDIEVSLRNEGSQIQRAFETALNSNFNEMDSKMKSAFEAQDAKLGLLKITSIILIIISLVLAGGLGYLLLK